MDEQPKKEESLLGQLMTRAKRALGLDDESNDSTAAQAARGTEQLKKLVQSSRGPEKDTEGLLVGDSRETIHENVRLLKSQGVAEDEAIRRAQAAAARKREKK